MSNELQSLQQLIEVSAAITETPSLSVKDFGIEREKSTNILIWSGVVSSAAKNTYAKLAGTIATSACIGMATVISSASLGSIGIAALVGTGAAAAGSSMVPVIGWTVAALIAAYGISRYRKAKKQQQEKERMYREIIRRQQAAIQKQKEIMAELEKMLRDAKSTNTQNSNRIKDLEQQIANLKELIEILTMQRSNFEAA